MPATERVRAIRRPSNVIRAVTLVVALLALAGCAGPVATRTAQPSYWVGMRITAAQAIPMPGAGDPVLVAATIENETGRDDELIGGTSPLATTVAVYGRVGETPGPTDRVTGLPNLVRIRSLPIGANEGIRLLPGYGGLILSGFSQPLVAGQTIQVTFDFAHADPVTLQITVASTPGAQSTAR